MLPLPPAKVSWLPPFKFKFTAPVPLMGLLKVNDQFAASISSVALLVMGETKLGSSDNTSVPPLIVVGPV